MSKGKTSTDAGPEGAQGHGFGTAPVFLASVSTILGAVMFLRFGYAVGHTGLAGAILIILLGHLVTIPTALAIAEIATNRRVEGGGEYFIISRSFGITIGGAIGISLYMSQAISVAFYMIAFAESFQPLAPWFQETFSTPFDPRDVSLPATIVLIGVVLRKGADLGVRALWVVASILALSLAMFFAGSGSEVTRPESLSVFSDLDNPDAFMLVFAIVFPAFTGMTAGVGLSGDLAEPRRSIPMGIMTATLAGMFVYVLVVVKLASSVSSGELASDYLIMSEIAVWGPIIPIGLACATISSAIGSILVAPRTLQALGSDAVIPRPGLNAYVSEGVGETNEPRNATFVTSAIAIVFVVLGNVDMVARIVSMFFMVTYGALCAISFLEHFAARPSYRPSFRSKWYVSLIGAVMCLVLMLQMDLLFALGAILVMAALYEMIRRGREGQDDLAQIFQGVMTQLTRHMQIRLQKMPPDDWRPSVISISSRTFDRAAPLQLLEWLCHRYGFGTYFHHIEGRLDTEKYEASQEVRDQLIQEMHQRKGAIYMDAIISPSMTSALGQGLQMPGISGMENNALLLEFGRHDGPEVLEEVAEGMLMAGVPHMDRLVLRHGDKFFGTRKRIHVWLTWHDARNANLMILLSYILLGHRDWQDAEVSLFAAYPRSEVKERREEIHQMIREGRLLISEKNVLVIPTDDSIDFERLVEARSSGADLVMVGFADHRLRQRRGDVFLRFPELQDVLFVSAQETIFID
ncbi:MAG: amino acid permease [Gemmatimonadota bacterium]|nr:amino acid permease [Gemmatimonadota bacterium]